MEVMVNGRSLEDWVCGYAVLTLSLDLVLVTMVNSLRSRLSTRSVVSGFVCDSSVGS